MKNRLLSAISLLIVAVMLASAFVGCNKTADAGVDATEQGTSAPLENPTEKSTEKPTEDQGDTGPEIPDPTKFNFYFNKDYVCGFVLPAEPTDAERAVAVTLSTALKAKTGKAVAFIDESKAGDYGYLVLIGNTSFQESKDAYALLGERESSIKVSSNNKLVIAFANQSSGIGIIEKMIEVINAQATKNVGVALTYVDYFKALPEIDVLPELELVDVKTIDCGEETTMLYARASTPDFDKYCESLLAVELEKVSEREQNGNLFATFKAANHYIYVYYSYYNSSMRVITGPIDQLVEEDYSTDASEFSVPCIAAIPQPKSGLGYIFRIPDGRYIILDGGYKDEDRVYNALRELAGDGEIVVAAWFISHPHDDHYMGLVDYAKKHGKDKNIVIERVIHNYALHEMYNIDGSAGLDESGKSVQELYDVMETYMPDVPVLKAHTGQTIKFGSTSIEILYTIEDLIPSNITNINDSSIVFRLNIFDQSIMLLTDTCYASGPILNKLWGSYLKSDIVQMAHHGMWPSVEEIYHSIAAEVILVPTKYKEFKSYIGDSRWSAVMQAALSYAKDIYVFGDYYDVIELPYYTVNNKAEMTEYIKNYK